MQNFRTFIIAIVSLVCGAAGTVATFAPEGGVQRTAATIANTCEANGVKAYPVLEAPAAPGDAGTPAPALEAPTAPSSPAEEPRTRGVRGEHSLAAWRWLPAVERWPGESKGWA